MGGSHLEAVGRTGSRAHSGCRPDPFSSLQVGHGGASLLAGSWRLPSAPGGRSGAAPRQQLPHAQSQERRIISLVLNPSHALILPDFLQKKAGTRARPGTSWLARLSSQGPGWSWEG